ncbi:MAG: TldD/PmbA family protein [Halobacteriovoraceae bacterium]|nr:TldD/PmbA family protein [Halobacteriovoraceae bacterium]
MKDIVAKANENAFFLAGKIRKKGSLPTDPSSTNNDFSTSKKRLTRKELIEFMKELDGYLQKYRDVSGRTLRLSCLDIEKSVITSDDSVFSSMVPRTNIICSLSTEKNGEKTNLNCVLGGCGHFEDVFTEPSDCFSDLDKLHADLMKKAEGVIPRAGYHQLILHSDLAGILAHEAIGHTTEADLVLAGSVAANFLNKQVASPLVTLVDFAHTALGKTCPVPVYTDDEGTCARDAVLIEKGILKGYMHNKESALIMNCPPTGNARAWGFDDEPLVRMRNTAILPGTSKLEDMIASVEDGYYLQKPANGEADSTSEFMFAVTMGYEIKKGKLGRAIKDTTISGVAFDMLKTVSMVSDDMDWNGSGYCGKGQLMTVGMGGPAVKCMANLGGR